MKSHVREAQAKKLLDQHLRIVSIDENGALYEVSSYVEEAIRQQAPEIKFRSWYCSKEGQWMVTASKGDKEKIVFGQNITECVQNAKTILMTYKGE